MVSRGEEYKKQSYMTDKQSKKGHICILLFMVRAYPSGKYAGNPVYSKTLSSEKKITLSQ